MFSNKNPIAHRGLHKSFEIPENSMEAFKRAVDLNYAIELDVRITKDNQIVVFHDKNLKRLCKNNKKVSSLNYNQLKKFYLYNTKYNIPLLQDVLDLIQGRVPIYIEVKNYSKIGIFEEKLASILDTYKGEFAICSFNENVIVWFKKNRSDFLRGLIYGDLKKFNIKFYNLVFIYKVFRCKPNFISLDYKLLRTFVPKIVRFLGLNLVSWTIDTKKKYKKAKQKVDNIIFEKIDLTQEFI